MRALSRMSSGNVSSALTLLSSASVSTRRSLRLRSSMLDRFRSYRLGQCAITKTKIDKNAKE